MGGSRKNEKHTWTPMSNEHPRIHMNSSEFHKRCSWQVRFWTIVFTFLIYYCVLLFLHLLVSFFFLFLVFHPVLAWRSQKLSIAIVAKHVFFLFGHVWKWGDHFPFFVTILESKKDTSCWDIPICSYCFGHVFLLLPCCVGLPHLKHIRLKFTDSL